MRIKTCKTCRWREPDRNDPKAHWCRGGVPSALVSIDNGTQRIMAQFPPTLLGWWCGAHRFPLVVHAAWVLVLVWIAIAVWRYSQ